MAKKTEPNKSAGGDRTLYLPIALRTEHVRRLCEALPGDGLTDGEKLAAIAAGALESLADGGLMLSPDQVQRLQDATQAEVSFASLLPLVEAGTGTQDGGVVLKWRVDPCYIPAFEQMAEFQGRSIEELFQDALDTAMDNGWFTDVQLRARQVLMPEDAHRKLEALLDGRFRTGTELASLIEAALATESLLR